MRHGHSLPTLELSIAIFCLLTVGMLVLVPWLLTGERLSTPSALEAAGAETPLAFRPSPTVPDALVGRALWGATTPTPAPPPYPTWVRAERAAPLRSRPDSVGDQMVTRLEEGSYLKVVGAQGSRLLVYYGGDGDASAKGQGWIDREDVMPARAPRWVETRSDSALLSGAGGAATSLLPQGALLEVLEDRDLYLHVFHRGDGRSRDAGEGWVRASAVGAAGGMLSAERRGVSILSYEQFTHLRSGDGLWLKVPFRTQFDGSPAAASNCGPASLGMALEYLGTTVDTAQLRDAANRLQGTSGPDVGFGIEHLASVAELFGARSLDLYQGRSFRRWSVEDLRGHLRERHPVIVELRFRQMPGRSQSETWDDHYVVITGVLEDHFIYNDSVDTDGPGYARIMTEGDLMRAWARSDFPFAAFAVAQRR